MVTKKYLILIFAVMFMNLETVAADAQEKPAGAQQKAPRHGRSKSADFHSGPVGNQQRGQELDRKEAELARREVVVNADEAAAKMRLQAAKAMNANQQKMFFATQSLLAQAMRRNAEFLAWQSDPAQLLAAIQAQQAQPPYMYYNNPYKFQRRR
jgi:hypothetical protein